MAVKVAINGFGRIGRIAFRQLVDAENIEVVALNDLTDTKTLAHLLKYDSNQGRFKTDTISHNENSIIVDGKEIRIFSERNPKDLPWGDLNVDVVIESTGFFTSKEAASAHLEAGAKKVLISAPAKGDLKTIVYNVNSDELEGNEDIISGASCTTNALTPFIKVLNDQFGLISGMMNTVHAYTGDQKLLDAPHSDLRRARNAATNIVPSSTGAAIAAGLVLPELKGKLDGVATRVPTRTGSIVYVYAQFEKQTSVEEINAAIKAAANETLGYTEDPIVSEDIIGITYGSLFDGGQTLELNVDGKQTFQLAAWYDNENSYVSQLVRTCKLLASKIA